MKMFGVDGVSRRGAMGAGLAGIASAATLGCAAPAAMPPAKGREPARFTDPQWNRDAAARLQAHTDGRQVYGMGTGVVCGVRAGEAVRTLMGFEVFSTIRVVKMADGNYQRMSKETIFYTDPLTNAILDEWTNPYTGEQVRVVDVANDPFNWVISAYIQPPPAFAAAPNSPPPEKKPFLMHWSQFGNDTVVVAENFHGYYPNRLDPKIWLRESGGPFNQTSELFRYFIDRSVLEDPNADYVPANGSWVRVTPWLPWMLMGQAQGHIMYDGVFRSFDTTEYIRPDVLARIRAKYPGYLVAPTSVTGPSLSSLEHYVIEQKPAPPLPAK